MSTPPRGGVLHSSGDPYGNMCVSYGKMVGMTLGTAHINWCLHAVRMYKVFNDPISFPELLGKLRANKYSHVNYAELPSTIKDEFDKPIVGTRRSPGAA